MLDRNTGGVRLTDAGAVFLEEARQILAHTQQAVVVAQEAAKGLRGRLTVAYYAPLLMGFIPASMKAFHEKFPDVDVTPLELPLGEQIAALESGSIHIGFAIMGSTPIPDDLKHVKVVRSPIRAVVGRSHRLAGARRIALADLVQEPLLCLVPKKGAFCRHGEIMRQIFAARGLKTGPIRVIEGAEAFRAILESGLGVSLIAEIGGLSRSRDLLFNPLKDGGDDLFVEFHAMWREGQTSQLTANFIDLMLKLASREMLSTKHGKRAVP